jgi:hypothetical protein
VNLATKERPDARLAYCSRNYWLNVLDAILTDGYIGLTITG